MTVLEPCPSKPTSSTLDMVKSINGHNNDLPKKKKKKSNDGSGQFPLDEIKQQSQYFTQLIDTIPPKIYFNKNEDILEKIENEKKRKFEDAPLTAKAKNKRIKFDPNAQQKVSDIANAYYVKKKSDNKVSDLRKKLAKRIKELREARGATDGSDSVKKAKKKTNKETESPNYKVPQIYNKEGNLVFSKFDFATHVDVATEKAMQEGKKKKKSLKGLLEKAKKEESKIAKVAQTNPAAAVKMKEKKLWKNALEKAEGHKVRDNPKLIEKALKQKKKQKVKHAKAWTERKLAVEKRQQFKQDKRQRHIEERKQQKKDKKVKLLKKKGRILN